MPDIVGIGAVNVDYIITRKADNDTDAANPPETRNKTADIVDLFDQGSERGVSAAEAERLLASLQDWNVAVSPGGSGLNTIASIAAMETERTVGYVGLCGRAPTSDFLFPTWLAGLGIDISHLGQRNTIAGTCVSYTEDGRRSLLTTPGVNADIMSYLAKNRDSIVDYLTPSKLVLVTSFANLEHINPLLDVIRRLRAIAPDVLICCDPGAMWTTPPVPAGVDELMAMADWILVNDQEAATLAPSIHASNSTTIVTKRADRVELSGAEGLAVYRNPHILTDDKIVDDTGAGDAFAAGLLFALTTEGVGIRDGVLLGMDLAREKLHWPGLGGIANYADIHRRFRDDRR